MNFKKGDKVISKFFGDGTVLEITEDQSNDKYYIGCRGFFNNVELKNIQLFISGLTKIDHND